jgi:tRNA A37 N6-isopentenylltransferase MiaA
LLGSIILFDFRGFEVAVFSSQPQVVPKNAPIQHRYDLSKCGLQYQQLFSVNQMIREFDCMLYQGVIAGMSAITRLHSCECIETLCERQPGNQAVAETAPAGVVIASVSFFT